MHCLVCGRPVSFTRHRLATRAHTMFVGLDALRIAEIAIADELDGEPYLRVVREGQELLEHVHDWVHAFVGPSLRVRRDVFSRVQRWRTNARVFVRAWASYDRSSYQEHHDSLTKLEARLVRRIVARSGRSSTGTARRRAPRIDAYAVHGRDPRGPARRTRSAGRSRLPARRSGLGHADAR